MTWRHWRVTAHHRELATKAVNMETWRHWATPINKHVQYKQNVPDHFSHTSGSWLRLQPATLGSSLITLCCSEQKSLKSKFPRFPLISPVHCCVGGRMRAAGSGGWYRCTVIWDQWTHVTSGPPPPACHFTSQSPGLAPSPPPHRQRPSLIKRLLPGATLKCYNAAMQAGVTCRRILLHRFHSYE